MDLHWTLLQRRRTCDVIDSQVLFMAQRLVERLTRNETSNVAYVSACWWMAIKYQAIDLPFYETWQLRMLLVEPHDVEKLRELTDYKLREAEATIWDRIQFCFPSILPITNLGKELDMDSSNEWLFALVHTLLVYAFPSQYLATVVLSAEKGFITHQFVNVLIFHTASNLGRWKQCRIANSSRKRNERVTSSSSWMAFGS